jgi:shikimate kinase
MHTSSAWRGAVVDRVILIGFMCSGKSTVGSLLAGRLDWEFVDFDQEIEGAHNLTIAEIFRDYGEEHFRRLEAELTEVVEDRRRVVLAPGGGWVTQPELALRLRDNSLTIWLRVQPDTVYRRHRLQGDVERPLLAGEDPRGDIRSLLAAREPLYQQADVAIETEGRTPAELVEEIAGLLANWAEEGPDGHDC